MEQKAKRKRTIYDDSLPRIFLWSGLTVFVILVIACVIIGTVIFFSNIQCITGSKEELEDTGSYAKGTVYRTTYEDINGTHHSLKFSSESGAKSGSV